MGVYPHFSVISWMREYYAIELGCQPGDRVIDLSQQGLEAIFRSRGIESNLNHPRFLVSLDRLHTFDIGYLRLNSMATVPAGNVGNRILYG